MKQYYVVRWRKPNGWNELDFENIENAYDQYQFELHNPVVTEVELIRRTDKVIERHITGEKK